MKTKTFLLLLFSAISVIRSYAQTCITPDPKLYECFDSSFIKSTLLKSPESILYYNFYLNNSYYIIDNDTKKPTTEALDIYKVEKSVKGKTEKIEFFSSDLSNFDIKKLNVLMYDFEIDFNKYTTYKMGKTGKLLIFYPKSVFLQKFTEYKKSLGY
ncbi:MAG: hypothetical protein HGB12_17230 [Bacteroidetes bacterium]|nr:hypothetical protein [Bacteroidota bacterium]